jgi:hypothetical protein
MAGTIIVNLKGNIGLEKGIDRRAPGLLKCL